MSMRGSILELAIEQNNELHIKRMNIITRLSDEVTAMAHGEGLKDVYLDDHVSLETSLNGSQVVLDPGYPTDDSLVVVQGAGSLYPRTEVQYTRVGDTLTFKYPVEMGNVEVGRTFTSSYTPTRPFSRSREEEVITTDRIRVARYRLSVIDSYEVSMKILSEFYDINLEHQSFNSRYLNSNNNLLGKVNHTSDELLFGFSQDAKYALAEFYTEGFLALTIDGITWEGQYYKSSKRMK
jgi:hypothetical protein